LQGSTRLLRDSLVYGARGWLNSLLGILLLPVLTQHLGTRDYGSLALVMLVLTVSQILILAGMHSAIGYYYNFSEGIEREKYISTSLFFVLISSLFYVVVLVAFHGEISRFVFHKVSSDIYLLIWAVPVAAILYFLQYLLIWSYQQKRYLIVSIGNSLSRFFLIIIFVVVLRYEIAGILAGYIIADSIFCVITVFLTKDFYIARVDVDKLKSLLKYGFPLLLTSVGALTLSWTDKVFVSRLLTLSDVGIYEAGVKVASVLAMVILGFRFAWDPYALRMAKSEEALDVFARIFIYYIGFTSIVWLAVSIFSGEILSIVVAEEFYPASQLVPYLAGSLLVVGITDIFSISATLTKKTYLYAIACLGGFGANVVLNYLLIAKLGIIGAAVGTVGASFIMCAMMNVFGQRALNIEYDYVKAISILLLSIGFWLACVWLDKLSLVDGLIIKPLVLVVYIVVVGRVVKINVSRLIKLGHEAALLSRSSV